MDVKALAVLIEDWTTTGALLLPFIMGLVTLWGKLGAQGRIQLLSSLATGLILGGLVRFAQVSPATLVGWIDVAGFGLTCGLAASGVYEVGKQLKKS